MALVAGTLAQGGAEKQFFYIARSLHDAGVGIHVFAFDRGRYYEQLLKRHGVPLTWVGGSSRSLRRTVDLVRGLRNFKPHIVQASHFFTNLYVTLAARLCGAAAVGSVRSDLVHDLGKFGFYGPYLLHFPDSIITNSMIARDNAISFGVPANAIHLLSNVIDLSDFDLASECTAVSGPNRCVTAMIVARLVKNKRIDRFLKALSVANQRAGNLRGVIVGDGPEKTRLQKMALALDLGPDRLQFLGHRNDVPALLQQADLLLVTSDREAFPNVILEGMAASLPVITTPAGDAAKVVEDGATGYVVSFDDSEAIATYMLRLAMDSSLRARLGAAGRRRVELRYTSHGLFPRIWRMYYDIATHQKNHRLLNALAATVNSLNDTTDVLNQPQPSTYPVSGCASSQ